MNKWWRLNENCNGPFLKVVKDISRTYFAILSWLCWNKIKKIKKIIAFVICLNLSPLTHIINQYLGAHTGEGIVSPNLRRHSLDFILIRLRADTFTIPSTSKQDSLTFPRHEHCGSPLAPLHPGLYLSKTTWWAGLTHGGRATWAGVNRSASRHKSGPGCVLRINLDSFHLFRLWLRLLFGGVGYEPLQYQLDYADCWPWAGTQNPLNKINPRLPGE